MPFSQDGSVEGSRKVPFSRELYIERDDFREDPPKKFHRLFPGSEVRLRYAYYVTCKTWSKTRTATSWSFAVPMIRNRRAGPRPDGRKIKGTIHWVSVPPRRIRRSAPVRAPVHVPDARQYARRRGVHGSAEPRLHACRDRAGRTRSGGIPRRVPRAVRAPRVFLCRSGQQARCACLQQDCDAQGFVGEDRRQTIKKREEGSCLWSVLIGMRLKGGCAAGFRLRGLLFWGEGSSPLRKGF